MLTTIRWEWALWPLVTSGICDNFFGEIPRPTTDGEAIVYLIAGGISVVVAVVTTLVVIVGLIMATATVWDWANGKKAIPEPTETAADQPGLQIDQT